MAVGDDCSEGPAGDFASVGVAADAEVIVGVAADADLTEGNAADFDVTDGDAAGTSITGRESPAGAGTTLERCSWSARSTTR